MKKKITVIDYELGNLLSIRQAFEYCEAEVIITDSINMIQNASSLVLPGVGAFEDGMNGLRKKNLIEPLKSYVATGKPLLGICLGMQMLFDSSEEFGLHQGLGFIPGKVIAIPKTTSDGNPHKVPHIGWNQLHPVSTNWQKTILDNIAPGECVYFVHSFTAEPAENKYRLADCNYHGRTISAAVYSENVWGFQFHPEKSGKAGLQMIRNFINLTA